MPTDLTMMMLSVIFQLVSNEFMTLSLALLNLGEYSPYFDLKLLCFLKIA